MFHFAPPEVNGFGVITSTPSFSRSSQVLMFLGLPLRVASTTTEFVTKPSYSSLFQSCGDLLGLDQLVHVGRQRQGDDVGLEAGLDGAGLVAGGAVGLLEPDVLAVGGLLEGGDDLLVRLLRRRVGDRLSVPALPEESELPPQAARPSATSSTSGTAAIEIRLPTLMKENPPLSIALVGKAARGTLAETL